MITVRNEFEMIPAYTTVAGSTICLADTREMTADILQTMDTVCAYDETSTAWQNLARAEEQEDLNALLEDAIDSWNECVITMPYLCRLELRDGEAIILPDVDYIYEDENVTVLDDYPDEYVNDFVAVVNDHGNVTLQQWNPGECEYFSIWEAV